MMVLHIPIGSIPIPSQSHRTNWNLLFTFTSKKPHYCSTLCGASRQNPPSLTSASSAPAPLRFVGSAYTREEDKDATDRDRGGDEEEGMVSSASAAAALIRKVSTSPVDFVQSIERVSDGRDGGGGRGLVLPSVDFRRLCLEQLDLFRRIVHPDALLSVYVRPAGSYVMDRLELRCITIYPVEDLADIVILVANFRVPAGLRTAEAALSSRHAELFPELRSMVFPLVKHPFVVGFLVAEFPNMNLGGEEPRPSPSQSCFLPSITDSKLLELQTNNGKSTEMFNVPIEQRLNAVNICRSLAMAYVMDQKLILLQQSSWQNNVRMSSLVEQIQGSLSSIRTLSKMLSVQIKRSEVAFDIVEDILVQGNHMQDIVQQLQDAVYLTKANIIHNNGEKLKKMHEPTDDHSTSRYPNLEPFEAFPLTSTSDSEIPMPPLALAPLQQEAIRKPCDVADVLNDLIGAVEPLARMQQRLIRASEFCGPLQVAVEEAALRQALSNLIEGALLRTEVGGKVEIVCTGAPAGGVLIIIDDDGPDMHYMTQMHSLTPFGMDLFSEDKVEDNMTWNFVAGLSVGREILERFGCVVRVISPRISHLGIQGRGTRIEIWLPYYPATATATGEFDEVV